MIVSSSGLRVHAEKGFELSCVYPDVQWSVTAGQGWGLDGCSSAAFLRASQSSQRGCAGFLHLDDISPRDWCRRDLWRVRGFLFKLNSAAEEEGHKERLWQCALSSGQSPWLRLSCFYHSLLLFCKNDIRFPVQ